MESKRFARNDTGFVCAHCGLVVQPLGRTSRNHCPDCLHSLHVDNDPGDRGNSCGGLMRPVGVVTDGRRGYLVIHRCERCGHQRPNRAALVGAQPDNMDRLLELAANPVPVTGGRPRRGPR